MWRVQHDDDDDSHAARLEEVLSWGELADYDQPLYIEIKEREPTAAKIAELLELVLPRNLARNGRPVFFRSFVDERIENIHLVRAALDAGHHPLHAHYVRTHALFSKSSFDETAEYTETISSLVSAGHSGVAFQHTTPDLFHLLHFARDANLGTGIWTVPESMGEVWCAGYREDVDALIIDYDISDCRTVAEEDTSLVYFDASTDADSDGLHYHREDADEHTVPLTGSGMPSLSTSTCCEGLLNKSLDFTPSLGDRLRLYDADNDYTGGYFVMLTVQFDDLDLGGGEKQSIIAKSDDGGFALELKDDLLWGTSLQWGVHVDGEYHWATKEVGGLDTSISHVIIAVYDGNGRARLWVNNSASGVDETAVLEGGVTLNDSPITVGADPQGWSDSRYHFNGKIQTVMVQKWRDH
jgi:hypothetical protein